MVKTKTKKMVSAAIFAALVLQNTVQHVTVHAEDTTESSSEWWNTSMASEYQEYWEGTLDGYITQYVSTQDPVLQASYLSYILPASMAVYSWEATYNTRELLYPSGWTPPVDYSPEISSTSIISGWYYRGGEPRSCAVFLYGDSGDAVNVQGDSVVYASADDFTIAINFEKNTSMAFNAFYGSSDNYGNMYLATQSSSYVSTLTFTSTSCSGIMSDYDFNDASLVYLSSCSTYSSITYDEVSISSSQYVQPVSSGRPGYFLMGLLKDSDGNPISNTYQEWIAGYTGDSLDGYAQNLRSLLDDNFDPEVVDQIWRDPQTATLPDTGTLDSLTFPPGLPNVAFQDPEIPTDSLPENAISGASFWFTTFSQMLDALGVKSIVIIFLIIILIMAILKI